MFGKKKIMEDDSIAKAKKELEDAYIPEMFIYRYIPFYGTVVDFRNYIKPVNFDDKDFVAWKIIHILIKKENLKENQQLEVNVDGKRILTVPTIPFFSDCFSSMSGAKCYPSGTVGFCPSICNPSNPLGKVLKQALWELNVSEVEQNRVYIIGNYIVKC